jgi:hypothetical protein
MRHLGDVIIRLWADHTLLARRPRRYVLLIVMMVVVRLMLGRCWLTVPSGLVSVIPSSVLRFMAACRYRATMMFSIPLVHRLAVVMVAPLFDSSMVTMFPRPPLTLVPLLPLVLFNFLMTFPSFMAIVIISRRARRRAQCQRQNHRR